MSAPIKIKDFIELVEGENLDQKSANFFTDLANCKRGINKKLSSWIIENPEVVTMRFANHYVFDYFYMKVTKVVDSLQTYDFWLKLLLKIIDFMDTEESQDIYFDHRYICNLQSGMKNHTKLFERLINSDFEAGDVEKLTHNIISRGELEKLTILNQVYKIECFKGIFEYALRYGRSDILQYLTKIFDIDDYPNIINLKKYTNDIKNIYYYSSLVEITNNTNKSSIYGSIQNHKLCFKIILGSQKSVVDINTCKTWINVSESTIYSWERVNFSEIMEIFRPYIKQKIPLIHDFGPKYNEIIFGKEWSDRKCIIEYCLQLERNLTNLQSRYDEVVRKIGYDNDNDDLDPLLNND